MLNILYQFEFYLYNGRTTLNFYIKVKEGKTAKLFVWHKEMKSVVFSQITSSTKSQNSKAKLRRDCLNSQFHPDCIQITLPSCCEYPMHFSWSFFNKPLWRTAYKELVERNCKFKKSSRPLFSCNSKCHISIFLTKKIRRVERKCLL